MTTSKTLKRWANSPDNEALEMNDAIYGKPMSLAGAERLHRQRGRPRSESPKVRISIYLSRAVLDKFKATGPGWQTRINDVLERAKI